MIQRLTLLAVLVTAIGMVGLFVSSLRSQARTADAIQQLSTAMASKSGTPDARLSKGESNTIGTVAIVGKVPHPGSYAMVDGLSVRRLAAAAGVDLQRVERVRVSRAGPTGTAVVRQLNGTDLGIDGPDVPLANGDIISIE